MYYPKVKFKIVALKDEEWAFSHFLKHRFDSYRKLFLEDFPELKNENLDLNAWLKEQWEENRKTTDFFRKKYQKRWDEIEEDFMSNLSKVINTSWFKKPKNIEGYLSLCKIFPRDIKKMTFFVPYKGNKKTVFSVVAHEITHFIYFKKFYELFPKRDKKYKRLEWTLSEILAPVILNNERISKIIPGPHRGYPIFYKKKIKGKTIMRVFEDKYKEYLEKEKIFNDYLEWAYEFSKKHQKEIEI